MQMQTWSSKGEKDNFQLVAQTLFVKSEPESATAGCFLLLVFCCHAFKWWWQIRHYIWGVAPNAAEWTARATSQTRNTSFGGCCCCCCCSMCRFGWSGIRILNEPATTTCLSVPSCMNIYELMVDDDDSAASVARFHVCSFTYDECLVFLVEWVIHILEFIAYEQCRFVSVSGLEWTTFFAQGVVCLKYKSV